MPSPQNPPLRLALATVLALALAACGGGGGNDDDDNDNGPFTLAIESTAALDGGITYTTSGTTNTASSAATPLVGDNTFQPSGGTLIYAGLWSFDLTALPANAQVQTATLRLYQSGTAGAPTAAFALARLDHANYGAVFPATSTVPTLEVNFAQLSDLDSLGPKQVDATAQVQADLAANRTRSQYRMRMAFATNNDAQADFCVMTDHETPNDPSQRPQLIVVYTTP